MGIYSDILKQNGWREGWGARDRERDEVEKEESYLS